MQYHDARNPKQQNSWKCEFDGAENKNSTSHLRQPTKESTHTISDRRSLRHGDLPPRHLILSSLCCVFWFALLLHGYVYVCQKHAFKLATYSGRHKTEEGYLFDVRQQFHDWQVFNQELKGEAPPEDKDHDEWLAERAKRSPPTCLFFLPNQRYSIVNLLFSGTLARFIMVGIQCCPSDWCASR